MALKESTATWKFVVGHHAIRSISIHGDTIELAEELLPILKVNRFLAHNLGGCDFVKSTQTYSISQANGIDLYINGHDHCLEHISSNDR